MSSWQPWPDPLSGTHPLWPGPEAPPDLNVTRILEQLVGEEVRVDLIHQEVVLQSHLEAEATDSLWPANVRLLQREVLLRGRSTGRSLLHALSSIAMDQLPESVETGLLHSSTPLGRLLNEAGFPVTRTDLSWILKPLGALCVFFGGDVPPTVSALQRTYVMREGSQPVARLTETFPLAALGFTAPT